MITNGATGITSQPSRVDGREQLLISVADASGAVRLVTSCCCSPLDGGQLRKNNSLSRQASIQYLHVGIWGMSLSMPTSFLHIASQIFTAPKISYLRGKRERTFGGQRSAVNSLQHAICKVLKFGMNFLKFSLCKYVFSTSLLCITSIYCNGREKHKTRLW